MTIGQVDTVAMLDLGRESTIVIESLAQRINAADEFLQREYRRFANSNQINDTKGSENPVCY